MRLGTLLLTFAFLASPAWSQARPRLPWEGLQPLAWQAVPAATPSAGPGMEVQATQGPLRVELSLDGTLRVRDARGVVRLQSGLPGRPIHAWRDGGLPLPTPSGTWSFPEETPLSQGPGSLQWCAPDFRPYLAGLLWVLEDGEGVLTVLHPATGRMVFLPLPPGHDLTLAFLADRLEVRAAQVERGAPDRWALPWMGLLPRLVALGTRPDAGPAGTALAPFPKG